VYLRLTNVSSQQRAAIVHGETFRFSHVKRRSFWNIIGQAKDLLGMTLSRECAATMREALLKLFSTADDVVKKYQL
jgi:hypothetical protein